MSCCGKERKKNNLTKVQCMCFRLDFHSILTDFHVTVVHVTTICLFTSHIGYIARFKLNQKSVLAYLPHLPEPAFIPLHQEVKDGVVSSQYTISHSYK